MKRVRNLETLTPKWTVPIKSFPSGIRETFKKRRQIDIARGNQENQTSNLTKAHMNSQRLGLHGLPHSRPLHMLWLPV